MSYKEINDSLTIIEKKIDKLSTDIEENRVIIDAHPVIFIALVVFFFVTMDLWTFAVHSTIKEIHPRGFLRYWEYILLALGSLLLLAWIAHRHGINLPMLSQ